MEEETLITVMEVTADEILVDVGEEVVVDELSVEVGELVVVSEPPEMVVEQGVEDETPIAVVEGTICETLMEVGKEAAVDELLQVLKEPPRM